MFWYTYIWNDQKRVIKSNQNKVKLKTCLFIKNWIGWSSNVYMGQCKQRTQNECMLQTKMTPISYILIQRGAVMTRSIVSQVFTKFHITRPLGRGMGCYCGFSIWFYILPQFLQLFVQYLAILGRVITPPDCICIHDGLAQDSTNPSALSMEFLQSCAKTSKLCKTRFSYL